jgi:hypothetical protein
MNRTGALQRMEAGFRKWTDVDLSAVAFVKETDLRFEQGHITCPSDALMALATDEDWREVLEPTKAWINASLLRTAEGRVIISLLTGPPVDLPEGEEPSINVSVEPRPLEIA